TALEVVRASLPVMRAAAASSAAAASAGFLAITPSTHARASANAAPGAAARVELGVQRGEDRRGGAALHEPGIGGGELAHEVRRGGLGVARGEAGRRG